MGEEREEALSGGKAVGIGPPGVASVRIGVGEPPPRAWPADIAIAQHEVDGIVVRAASARGLLHRLKRAAAPRQDSFGIVWDETSETLVAVVCDGVGSLDESDEAAQFVSRRLPNAYFSEGSWQSAFAKVNSELAELSSASDGEGAKCSRPMGTTAIGIAVRKAENGFLVECARVGDSMAWSLEADGKWEVLSDEPTGNEQDEEQLATGRTSALPTPRLRLIESEVLCGSGKVFLMTDGVGLPLSMSLDVQEALADWWRDPPDGLDFAREVSFARRSFIDDRTVVGIWRLTNT